METMLLPGLAVGLALLGLLTTFRAPDWMWAWKVAILAGEYGHWLAGGAVGVGAAAYFLTDDPTRALTMGTCGFALVFLLRPVLGARRLAAELPAALQAAFGPANVETKAFSWVRLFLGRSAPKARIVAVDVGDSGHPLPMDLYLPAEPGAPRAAVVMIHGGGWDGGDRGQLPEWNDWLVAKGYVVAAVSYRLAPQWQWPAQRDDLAQAIAWLKREGPGLGVDPARLVLFGRSAGGQIASAYGYGTADPAIRGVVALYAPHDMPFVWSVSREDDALQSAKLMRQYFGGPPDASRREQFRSASAQALATPAAPPTLLAHGVPDTLSWVRHADRLAPRLAELGVPHYFLRLRWATHAFDFNRHGPGGQLLGFALEWFLQIVTRRAE